MPVNDFDKQWAQLFHGHASAEHEELAPSRLKSRAYSALIRAQQETGPLQTLTQSQAAGHGLCVFEKLVQTAPIGERVRGRLFQLQARRTISLYEKYRGQVNFVVIDLDRKRGAEQQELLKKYYKGYIPHVVVLDRQQSPAYNP